MRRLFYPPYGLLLIGFLASSAQASVSRNAVRRVRDIGYESWTAWDETAKRKIFGGQWRAYERS